MRLFATALLAFAACSSTPARAPAPRPPPADLVVAPPEPQPRVPLLNDIAREHRANLRALRGRRPWLRGSTHVHTLYSGDSRTRPKKVVRWYGEAGYDFIVITDHNRITDGVSADLRSKHGMLVLKGNELTNNPPACDPPPPDPKGKCRVHVNALFVTDYPKNAPGERPEKIEWREKKSIARVDLYQAALTKSSAFGGLAQLNHPTWHWGVDGKLTSELASRGLKFIEIANVAFDRWNGGDGTHPGTEEIWDAALSAGHRLWAVASDDAHHYYDIERVKKEGGALYPPGGGFVMVRAERDAKSIRRAMARGDFYASTGILLDRLEVSETELIVAVARTERRGVAVEFVGAGGAVLKSVPGNEARFELSSVAGSYVRARVVAADGSRAWSQPVFVDKSPRD